MNKQTQKIFPFVIDGHLGRQLFDGYVVPRRDELDEKYGSNVITTKNGVTGNFRIWSYAEVTVEALSETKIRFTTYEHNRMYDSRFGMPDPGQEQNIFEQSYQPTVLASEVERRKREIAEAVYVQRQEEERKRAVNAVYDELFK